MIDMDKRDRPYPYIMRALSVLKELRMSQPVIVEIGACRMIPPHPIDEYNHPCCSDGHSSILFARTGYEFHTCDRDKNTLSNLDDYLKRYGIDRNVNCYCEDGIEFLKKFSRPIDLLFLDGWDLCEPDSALRHYEAYRAAKPQLKLRSMIVIDDTDVEYVGNNEYKYTDNEIGGKGSILAPALKSEGWSLLYTGRQTGWIWDKQ